MPSRTRFVPAVGVVVAALALVTACTGGAIGSAVPSSPTTGDAADPTRGPCGSASAEVLTPLAMARFGVERVAMAGASPACSTAAIASGSPWPVSIRGAADAVRRFAGIDVPLEVSGPFDGTYGRMYTVASAGALADGTFMSAAVDAATGRVASLHYQPRLVDWVTSPARVSRFEATDAARSFLASHSIAVDGLETWSDPGFEGAWDVTWQKMDGGTGVFPRVTVTVDWTTGRVTGFEDVRLAYTHPATATVTRDQASRIALESTWLASPKVESARLQIDVGYDGLQTLIWKVVLSGLDDPAAPRPSYLQLRIDAATGAVVG